MSSSLLAAPPQPDADMQRLLQTWSAMGGRHVSTLSPAQARSQPSLSAAVDVLLKKLGKPTGVQAVAKVESFSVQGAEGPLPARVYTPKGEGPFPVLTYFHGGGWVLGGIPEYDSSARALANAAGCIVVSVGYRQAPEHPYPAAVKDAYAAFNDVVKEAKALGGDPRRVAVAGEGSGATLAAVVCLMAMEQRTTMPSHQLLICPLTTPQLDSVSHRHNAGARPYSTADLQWFFQHYLSKKEQAKSPYVSLLKKPVSDLPPATVIVAELDPAAWEGQAYHKMLLDNAINSQLGLYSGVTADFFGTGAVVAKAKKAQEFAGQRLVKAFTINRPGAPWKRPKKAKEKTPPAATPGRAPAAPSAPAAPTAPTRTPPR